jgi:hypothetical protein
MTTKQRQGVINGVKVFSATMVAQRQVLGETVSAWLEEARAKRTGFAVVDIVISQSSDNAFHCISAVLFFQECLPKASAPKERSHHEQPSLANAGITSKAKTATDARTAISNAAAVDTSPTNVSANAPKKRP